uniref:Uncharacterized protein n=1 Tax=Palpitomonas bilix TaxID=652834 RepID=A0A7S3GKG9_9EUKA|mmetsp:Transcript_7331/g.19032  ORF Transcript_7331/g.19032 Transcript_7331/m.19032 type:complete len:281 (+) Transcript_7331:48-890(+)
MQRSRSVPLPDVGEPIVTPRDSVRRSGRFVRLYLDEHVRHTSPRSSTSRMDDILASCTILDTLLDQGMSKRAHLTLDDGSDESKRIHAEVERLQRLVLVHTGCKSFAEGYKQLGLAPVFELCTALFQQEGQPGFSKEELSDMKGAGDTVDAYFDTMVPINQLNRTAAQVEEDVREGRLKYLAHQIALVYQALVAIRAHSYTESTTTDGVSLRELLSESKQRIESQFEEIKRVTEKAATPYLPQDLREWLEEELQGVRMLVRQYFPCQQRAAPFIQFIKQS